MPGTLEERVAYLEGRLDLPPNHMFRYSTLEERVAYLEGKVAVFTSLHQHAKTPASLNHLSSSPRSYDRT